MPALLDPRRVVGRYAFPVKVAAGDIQTFENSLATIGRSFLMPKAPALFKHEIGFQVLDSDDDNTRAVGVFGFRVGKRLLYVPLFYRDGVVKGTEQLRDPKRKICVPLSDNWVNKFLSEQGDSPAKLMPRAANKDNAQPSLWQLKYPPSKYAAEDTTLIKKDLARAIGRAMGQIAEVKSAVDAENSTDLIKYAIDNPAIFDVLGQWARDYAWFGDALEKYHGRAKIATAIERAKPYDPIGLFEPPIADIVPLPPLKKAADDGPGASLTIVRVSRVQLRKVGKPGGPKVESLYDPEEWQELRLGNNLYKDRRGPEEKSKVTLWLGGNLPDGETLANPSEHGIYEVLGPGHTYYKCAVLTPLVGWGPSIGRCLVVRIDDGAWAYAHPNAVWVRGQADQPEFAKWVGGLPTVKKDTDGIPEGTYAGIARVTSAQGAGGFAATTPFTKPNGDSSEAYPLTSPDKDAPFWSAFNPWNDRTDSWVPESMRQYGRGPTTHHTYRTEDDQSKSVEVFDECSQPVLHGRQLYLPVDCHLIKLNGGRFRPADGSDPERVLFSRRHSAGDKTVELTKLAYSTQIHDPRTDKIAAFAVPADAEAYLVESHGLDVADARKLMSAVNQQKKAAVMLSYGPAYKTAADPDMGLAHNFPVAPTLPFDQVAAPASFADDVVPTETGSTVSVPINDLLMQPGAFDRYRPYPIQHGVQTRLPGIGNDDDSNLAGPSTADLNAVAAAAQSGKRDLFDTASFAAIVKYKRLDTLLNDSRTSLGRAVTVLGDNLAHLYWNTDEWAERFGEGEIGPLEDQMLSQFEKLGELVLTLREKSIDGGIDAGILPSMSPADNSESAA